MKTQSSFVLIVDDAPEQTQILSAYLRAQNADITIFTCGTVKEAIELYTQKLPKMVILDLSLTDGSGEEVLKHIRETGLDTHVLIVTGDRSEETLTKLFELGADDYITKPVDELIFRSKTRSLLSGRYVSPLSFLGKRQGIGSLTVAASMKISALNEKTAVLSSSFHIQPGGVFFISLGGMNIQMRVRHCSMLGSQGHYRLECQIVEKSVTDGPALRRYIFANKKSQQKEAVS